MADEIRPILTPGSNCWRLERAERFSVVVDAAEYFHLISEAFEKARRRILILGWDFDTLIPLHPDEQGTGEPLGWYFLRLAHRHSALEIKILKWHFGALKLFRGLRALYFLLRWRLSKAIDFRLDGVHPPGCSHHQKIVIVDERFAACGGIDISGGRWDTSRHNDDEPRRKFPGGTTYGPWHDATAMVSGPIAGALAELGRDRWLQATKVNLQPVKEELPIWPTSLAPLFQDIVVGISRTRAEFRDFGEIRENELLYLDMIAAAKNFIYIENQYFTSGKIAAAIAERMQEAAPPEIVMIMPRYGDGWLEQKAMDAARIKLAREIAKVDRQNKFRIYVPVTQGRQDIYVHAKIAIVDDRLLRIGSANLNNRSMGLDSECDVIVDAAIPQNAHTLPGIKSIRLRLMSEHLGVTQDIIDMHHARSSSIISCIDALICTEKSLELLDLTPPGPLEDFIAENELLDPRRPADLLEPINQRSLWSSWKLKIRTHKSRSSSI